MAAFFDHDFLTRPRVQLDGYLVSHRARRYKDRRFFFEDFRGALLQAIYGRIFAVNIVTDFGLSHRATHRGCRFGDCVAAQIDHCFGNSYRETLPQNRQAKDRHNYHLEV